ncbi:hypothetical protein PC121_g11376 [Phytophthora cactorum]|nr:hypothetical protein PC121_g11376 [Phytophthora cactorum]
MLYYSTDDCPQGNHANLKNTVLPFVLSDCTAKLEIDMQKALRAVTSPRRRFSLSNTGAPSASSYRCTTS